MDPKENPEVPAQWTHEAAHEGTVPLCEDDIWKPTETPESPHSGLMRQPAKDVDPKGIGRSREFKPEHHVDMNVSKSASQQDRCGLPMCSDIRPMKCTITSHCDRWRW